MNHSDLDQQNTQTTKVEYAAGFLVATIFFGGLTAANQDEPHPSWLLFGITSTCFFISLVCCFANLCKTNSEGKCVSDFSVFKSARKKLEYKEIPEVGETPSPV